MIKATDEDKQSIIDILARSFGANQSVNYIIRQDKKRPERIDVLMDYSFDVCKLFGEVWLSEEKKACALVLYPHIKKTTPRSIYLDLKLIFRAIGLSGINKAMKREALIKEKQPKVPMAYLWFIGVDPQYQHSGIGSKLLKEVIEHAKNQRLPVYLETSTERNLPWYHRSGFQIYDQLVLTYVLHFLKYERAK